MIFTIYFIFGLIVGSFLNAVIFRLHKKKSFVSGRSECMKCHTTLQPMDLIPLFSFIFLKGRCRYCSTKLSWQYPAVEFGTALVFGLLAVHGGEVASLLLFRNIIFAAVLIVIAVYDWKHYLILDKVVFPSLVLSLVLAIALDWSLGYTFLSFSSFTLGGVLTGLLISGFFLFQYVISKGTWIGFGDVKLGLLLGLILGWPEGLLSLFVAYIIGALFGLVLIAMNKKQMSSRLPFGTFLSFSAIITLIYGDSILNWYLTLLGY